TLGTARGTPSRAAQRGRAATVRVLVRPVPLPPGVFRGEGEAIGPDGNTWLLGGLIEGSSVVWKLSPAGQVLGSFPLPPGTLAQGLAPGPGDALSFFSFQSHTTGAHPGFTDVGQITTSGVVSVAPLSSPEFKALPSGERATTIGADGNLWAIVAKPGHETALSRTLPTTGATNSYPIPASPGEALSISSGTDGHIWLVAATEARARASIKLVRVTPPDARPQVIPIPGRLQQTFTLTAAPAGAIWITAGQPGTYESDYIARVQSNGAFKKFKLPG